MKGLRNPWLFQELLYTASTMAMLAEVMGQFSLTACGEPYIPRSISGVQASKGAKSSIPGIKQNADNHQLLH